MSSTEPHRHKLRDGLVTGIIVAEAVISGAGDVNLVRTPTTPGGQPLISQEVEDLAAVKQKQDEDRLFEIHHAVRPPEQAEYRDRESRPER